MGARSYRCAVLTALIAAVSAGAAPAAAQPYPNRPITLVVPFPPGGSATIIARIIADKMSEALGQQIVVDNRGGAGGSIAARQVAKSAPDGYTLLLAFTGTLADQPAASLPMSATIRARISPPIGLIGMAPSVLAVHPSVPAHSVADLIEIAKAAPGKIQYGSPGIGTHQPPRRRSCSPPWPASRSPTSPTRAPGPAITDLLGGHIAMMFAPIPAAHGNVSAGTLRALGVTSLKRSSLLPDIPTIAEAGLPGFEVVQTVDAARARRHAAPDHRAAQQGAQRRARHRRGEEAARGRRRRADAGRAGGIRGRHRPRGDAMVEAGATHRPQG